MITKQPTKSVSMEQNEKERYKNNTCTPPQYQYARERYEEAVVWYTIHHVSLATYPWYIHTAGEMNKYSVNK